MFKVIKKSLLIKVLLTLATTFVSILMIFLSDIDVMSSSGNMQIIYSSISSKNELKALLKKEFRCNAVKPVAYTQIPSLSGLTVKERKEAFLRLILPSVLIAEKKIDIERKKLITLKDKINKGLLLTGKEHKYLSAFLNRYKTDDLEELLFRLNSHSPSIILAQAALESGWGTSRFFTEANNIFGVWTFKKGRGLKAISSNARLSTYPSTLHSVGDYLYNINVGWAYKDFRLVRARSSNTFTLINHLDRYSTLGSEYVKRLNRIIRSNNLKKIETCSIDPSYIH